MTRHFPIIALLCVMGLLPASPSPGKELARPVRLGIAGNAPQEEFSKSATAEAAQKADPNNPLQAALAAEDQAAKTAPVQESDAGEGLSLDPPVPGELDSGKGELDSGKGEQDPGKGDSGTTEDRLPLTDPEDADAKPLDEANGEDEDDLDDDLDFDLPPLEEFAAQPYLVDVPTVFSASLREERSTEAPGTVIVIDKTEIRRRGYSQLIDVLRDLPGMETLENYFSEFGTQVPVRGISGNNKIVVLVNGMRVNPPGGENFPFRRDFSVRFAERVEIVYGSGSTLYGQDAISAVINVVMKQPEGENIVELGGEVGENYEREIWAWTAGTLKADKNIKVSSFIQYHDSQLTDLDTEYPAYWQDFFNVASTKTNANGKGVRPDRNDYGLNVFGRLEGYDSSIQVWHRASERSSAEGGYANTGLGYLPEAQWGDYSTAVEAANTWKVSKHKSFQTIFTYNDYQIDRDSRYVFPASPTEWFLDDFKWGRGWSLELEEIYRFEPSKDFSLLAGGVMRYSDVIPKSTFIGGYDPRLDPVAQSGTFNYVDGNGDPQTIPQVSQVTFWTFAAYLEGQYQMFDKLRLVGGVRATTDERYDEKPITPRFAAIYNMTDRFTSKYMYTQAFVAPAPYFAFATYDNGTLLATTNPDVAPETAETHELNFTYYGDDISLGLSVYHGTQADLIIVSDQAAPQNIVEDPVTVNGNPRTLVQTANGGDSVRYGVDFYGKVKRGSTDSWFSYSYVDFEQTNLGLVTGLPLISRHNGRLGVTWQATQRLFLTPSLVIRSTPENVAAGSLRKELHDPYEINFYALYQRNRHVDLFLDLRNVTDHDYALGGFTGDAYAQETFSGVVGMRLTY